MEWDPDHAFRVPPLKAADTPTGGAKEKSPCLKM